MRPVNLLPEGRRPRGSGDATGNAPKVTIWVLSVLLAMVAGYVLTANQVNSRQSEIATARADAEQARARAAALAPYAQLAAIKQARISSVRELAGGRFDWERLIRELSMVMPDGIWLLNLTASTSGEDGASSAPAEPGAATSGLAPSVKLEGCAPSQPAVATLLVRLRKLNRVEEVKLGESRREDSVGGGTTDSAGASADSCGPGRFRFDVTVNFAQPDVLAAPRQADRVPASLGGGQ